jgi:hypothetical protein
VNILPAERVPSESLPEGGKIAIGIGIAIGYRLFYQQKTDTDSEISGNGGAFSNLTARGGGLPK